MSENKNVQKLLDQQAKIKEKLKIERDKEKQKRKEEYDLKCKIVGSALLQELKTNSPLEQQIKPILDKHVKSKKQRALLGLQ